MGLFGDKKLKALKASLDVGFTSIVIGAKMGNGQETMRKVTYRIQDAAKALANDGRKAEATTAIRAARRSGGTGADQTWNELLDAIASDL